MSKPCTACSRNGSAGTDNSVYPHAVVYDFEAYIDKTKRYKPTDDLTYENTNVPISVLVGDTVDGQPTHICNVDPKALITSFMTELKRRAAELSADVKQHIIPTALSCCRRNSSKKFEIGVSNCPCYASPLAVKI